MGARGPSLLHLAVRFFGSVRPGAPAPSDEQWAIEHLTPGEQTIWRRMSNPDRRHAVQVARDVVDSLDAPPTPVVAAALMHDSGKVISNYRTPMRVVATVVWGIVDQSVASSWLDRGWPRRRLAQYRLHPELGAEMLADAGADEFTVHWAADHHRPADAWRVPADLGQILKACDGD